MLTELAMQNRQRHRAGQRLDRACGGSRSFCPPSTPSSGRVPRRSPVLTGASTTPWPNHWRTRIAAASTDLLKRRDNGKTTWVAWLRQSPAKAKFAAYAGTHRTPQGMAGTRSAYRHRAAGSPEPPAQDCPRGRPDDTRRLAKFEPQRRYATLVARWPPGHGHRHRRNHRPARPHLGKLFNAAKNSISSSSGVRQGHQQGTSVRAHRSGADRRQAIRPRCVCRHRAVIIWDSLAESVTEAQKLAQPDDFRFPASHRRSYATLRRYAPEFLAVLKLQAAPAKNVLDAIEVLRGMNTDNARKLPADAPTGFISRAGNW